MKKETKGDAEMCLWCGKVLCVRAGRFGVHTKYGGFFLRFDGGSGSDTEACPGSKRKVSDFAVLSPYKGLSSRERRDQVV